MSEARLFLRRLLLFCLPMAVGAGVVEVILYRTPNTYSYKRECFEGQLDRVEVLVLGSSQPLFGVNPAHFSRPGFNLANVSQTLYYDKALTLKYLGRLHRLKLVLIPISYFSFDYQLYDTRERWRDYYYRTYWDVRYPELPRFDLRDVSRIALYSPAGVVSLLKNGFRTDFTENLLPNGFIHIAPVAANDKISEAAGRERVKVHDGTRHPARFARIAADLEGLVAALTGRGIAVAFLTTPVLPTYARYCNPQVLRRNRAVINRLCRTYGCRYYDYFTDRRFPPAEFSDNDHLNATGAARFSRIIDEEILRRPDQDLQD
ncbi:MAG: hypothetical protein AVDCRST_MAG56-542 [uncultured Cytophagales bacterium]|uniref:SGNH/GDSL hydrolase family protein n=1 Tax=uncultured Cytophagales bacterium TaxID=158755 RepID=A0A6J4HH28_9SPHI|nr:MAG: hypothetical protein AVDCRST_MAG56-542 [uncultured Cytophagales bacterium]